MSETPPDPADVHTGTDRVELTKDERLKIGAEVAGFLAGTRIVGPDLAMQSVTPGLARAVESIVAAHVQALTTERDELRASLPKRTRDWLAHCKVLDAERDAVSDQLAEAWKQLGETEAELAAANTSAAEKAVLAREWADKAFGERAERDRLQAEIERLRELMTPAQKELDGIGITWQSRAKRMAARVAALQETLDRVTAEVSLMEHGSGGWMLRDWWDAYYRLRAALTPEGKP